MFNPFVTKGYGGAEYFCDRVKETQDLVQLLTNENNMALISPRRLGKTDLIRHCFNQPEIRGRYYTFMIDIYATRSLRDFVNVFGKARNVTGGAFLKKYHLWSASSVMSALKGLLDKDFVTQEGNAYMAYDQFFAMWVSR